ncbi:MAG TPA: anti-sigma factor antagonist [bacterium]|nr:anti-sigma factor antagonist [bacterium]
MFSKQEENGVTIISINQDRLDTVMAPDLKTELLLLVDQGVTKILVDLSNVVYVDSSGLGALLFGVRQMKNLGGHLILCGANSKVSNLIKIARLETHLKNYRDRKQALASLNRV